MGINLGKLQDNDDYIKVDGLRLSKTNNPVVKTAKPPINTKTNNTNNKWYNNFFKKSEAYNGAFSNFNDGYDFGDITKSSLKALDATAKTMGASALDAGLNLVEGVANVGTGAGKLISGGIAQVADWIGKDEYANKVRKNIATKENPITASLNKLESKIDKNSIFGNTSDEIASLVGYTGGLASGGAVLGGAGNIPVSIAGKTLNVPTLAAISGAGEGLTEAYSKKNVSDAQAWTKALGSGAIEGITEGLFGMFGVGGNEITDQWGKQAASMFKSGIAKTLAKTGVSASGEAAEEFLSYLGNQGLDKIIDIFSSKNSAKFHEKWDWGKVGEEMALAFISAGLTQGGSTIVQTQILSNNAIKKAEQELNRELTAAEKQSIRNQITDSIIKGETTNNNQQEIDLASTESQIEALKEKRLKTKDENTIAELNAKINELQAQLNQVNENIIDGQNNAENVQNDTTGLNLPVAKESKVNLPKIEPTTFEESAKYHNINPKTSEYKFAKAIKDKLGVNVLFKNKVANLKGDEVNGLYNPFTKTIELNINSGQTVQHLLTHELTHALEGTKEYQSIQNLVMDYSRKANPSLWANAVNELSSVYFNDYGNRPDFQEKVNSEATAEILGNLINDQEFLNHLAKSNPNIFTKLYALINDLIARATGNEKAYLNSIKAKMEIAWKQASEDKIKQGSDVKYSKSLTTTAVDNHGNEVNPGMQKYMSKSRARVDEELDKPLVLVYHTTTDEIPQFNEFNPVGTQYYRFGDQVVNYYTDSKDMSGSYANQKYEMADTRRITSMNEVNKLIEEHNNNLNPDEKYDYNVEIVKDGDGYKLKVTSQPGASYSGVIEEFYPRKYKNDIDLFKRIKNDIKNYRTIRDENGRSLSNNKKIQYEGYVNITNPYVVDAEERNWNQVVSQSNDFIDELDERIPQDIKDNLTRLYQESANKSAEAREKYNGLHNVIDHMGFNSSVDENVKKVNEVIKKVGVNEIEEVLNDTPMGIMGVRGWYNLAEALESEGLIGNSTAKLIIDDFKLPEQVKETLKKYYNEPIDRTSFYLDLTGFKKTFGEQKTATLKEIYNKDVENYNEFNKYRMPNSYFLESISSDSSNPIHTDMGYDLNDMFETRAETMGTDTVGEEIAQAASVAFSKPEMIRLWGTSKTTNDVVKEIIASNKDGSTNYDGVIIKNVVDYGGYSETHEPADLYITFASNQFKAKDNENPTEDPDIRYSSNNEGAFKEYIDKYVKPINKNKKESTFKEIMLPKAKETAKDIVLPIDKKESNQKLSKKEYEEYKALKDLNDILILDEKDEARLNELSNKYKDAQLKYSELKTNNTFADIKKDYAKYINDESTIDKKIINKALEIVQANNQGRRTKEQWLDIAKMIGQNYKGNTEGLKKYAFRSFFELSPNQKENLNRQGQKYVNFGINEWVNEVYKGAGVGEIETKSETTPTIPKPKTNHNLPLAKLSDVLKVAAEDISKEINTKGDFDGNLRRWARTSTESEVLKDKVYLDDLDLEKMHYTVLSNKKSLDSANNHIEHYGYEKSLEDAKALLRSDKLPSASDVALIQRMIQEATKKGDYQTAQELIMDTAIIGTDLGQATQALSIIKKLTPEGQLKMYTKLVQRAKARGEKSFEDVEITPEMVKMVLDAYNNDGTYNQDDLNERVEKFKQKITDQIKPTAIEKIDAWRYLAMLGNLKTHIRNIVSNVAMKGTIKVKNALARTLESVLPVKERTKTWKEASSEIKEYASKTAEEMKDIITGENKYNEKTSLENKKQVFKNKALEKLRNFNSNALEKEDWLFSKSAFKTTLQEYLTANGINTLEDIENNSELVEKAKLYAVEQAEIATFRQYSKLASKIGQIERGSKVGKIAVNAILPFKKTPINIAKAGINFSPLGLIKNMTYDAIQLKKGNINASQFIDNLAQGLTGTSLLLIGYALAKAGILTGSGGDDKDDKYDKQLGNTGYSLVIGGNSYTISWLSPVAMPLLVGANAYEQLEEEKEWDMNVVSDTLAKTLDPLNEMSFLQGLTNALQSYGGGTDKIKGSLESTGQNYVGQFFPTLFSQLASTLDDKKRSTKASNNSKYKFGEQTVRSVMYKLPGIRQKLEVSTDIWGNEKEQSSNIIQRAFESFISPYSRSENISTALDEELKKIYNETGENGVIPSIPYAYITYGNNTYRMSASEYTKYKKTYGQTANKLLNKTIESSGYKSLSTEEKAKILEDILGYSKYVANKEYFNNTDVEYSNSKYQKADLYSKIGNVNDYYLSKIKTFTSDTDVNGKTISGSAKNKVIQYINSLKASVPEKAILIKLYGNYTFNDYNQQIINYINGKNITLKEKEEILTELGFKIKNGRVYQ